MDQISNIELVLYGAANILAATLSGIGGAGGGFIMTPVLIFLGLPPAQAVATGKLSGLSLSVGSLSGLHKTKIASRKQVVIIVSMAVVIGLIAPFIITQLDNQFYRQALGILLLAMIPVLIFKKVGHQESNPSTPKRAIGYVLLLVSMSLQAVFSGGLGTLVNIVLMAFLGMSALEANVTKRYSQVVLNSLIVIGVFLSGLIVWKVALVGIVTGGIGGFIGGRIAVKRGNAFVMTVFIILMFLSSMALLFG